MILFRLREWGSGDWHYLSLHSEEEGEDMRGLVAGVIGSALATSDLHVQIRGEEDGQWEDLE